MAPIEVLVIEDDPLFAVDCEMVISEAGFHCVKVLDTAEKALIWVEENRPDLILLDIHLNGKMSGLEFAKSIQNTRIPIIYVTSDNNPQTYFEAKSVGNPIVFLVKPFDKLTLQSAIESLLLIKESNENNGSHPSNGLIYNQAVFIKNKAMLYKVPVEDILYLMADGNYVMVYTKNKKYVIKVSLKRLVDELPGYNFLQVHRNYVVQLDKIEKIDSGAMELNIGDAVIPIGRKYKEELLSVLRVV
jgi:DNA-binding LytR/AlgR family response regulator